MKMYKTPTITGGTLKFNNAVEGETIEQKIERIVSNKEPIKDGAPILYTDRKEGIKASTNIRTDRWEVALDATDKIQKSYQARREDTQNKKDKKKDDKVEPIQGTTPTT